MNTFESYIIENNEDYERAFRTLERDCLTILNLYEETGRFFYRGSSRSVGLTGLLRVIPRKDRKPKDTPIDLHNKLDSLFRDEFGWNVRSEGVMTTPRKATAYGYSSFVYVVFPSDRFKFVWSKDVSDLFETLGRGIWATNKEEELRMMSDIKTEKLKEIVETYVDFALGDAVRSKNEVIFKCDYYYLVDLRVLHKVGLGLSDEI